MTDDREHWDERYRSAEATQEPATFLDDIEHLLPAGGSMVDVAGGGGRNALWFAARGFDATVVDVSAEGLAQARQAALARGLEIECVVRDLSNQGLPPERHWNVALMHLYSNREVLMSLPAALHPDGLLLFAQPTMENLERHARPSSRHLLVEGEIHELATELEQRSMTVIEASADWRGGGRHEARLVARRRR